MTLSEGAQASAEIPPFATCANGRRIYVDANDARGQRLLATQGDANPNSLAAWRLLAQAPWTHVVDVGANYGEMLLSLDFNASTALLAVEPNPALLPHLQRSIDASNLPIRLCPNAIAASEGVAHMLIDESYSGLSRLGSEPHPESEGHRIRTLEVRTLRLDQLLGDATPPEQMRLLLKLDVEGHECDALRSLGDKLALLADFACLVEVLHLPRKDLDWLVAHFQPEVFDPLTTQFIPVHGDSQRLLRLLQCGAFHPQDIALRRRPFP